MQTHIPKEEITRSLRTFKSRRDDLLHEDVTAFDHHLERFVEFCRRDTLVQLVLAPLESLCQVDEVNWWNNIQYGQIRFPEDPEAEFLLRFRILESISNRSRNVYQFHIVASGRTEIEFCRTIVVRPFAEELTHRLGEAADLASPEARIIQAVPLNRIPSSTETKIFLSHKTVDKPLVYRYYNALKEVGFAPWLDETVMTAGSNLEREVFRGLEESCAAVFFITENFRDEEYLAAEVDYAVMQKRKKKKKFAIITLRYSNAAEVPGLLTPYIYKDIENDLQGLYELLRALPLELGPVRWKEDILD